MKNRIYIWLPAALSVYLLIMFFMYKDQHKAAGTMTQFYVTIGIELLIIIALVFFLRYRVKMRLRREAEEQELMDREKELKEQLEKKDKE